MLGSIVELLSSKHMDFEVHGDDISVRKMAAIGLDVQEAICYYVGDDPESLTGVGRSIVICKPGLKVDPKKKNTYIFTKNPQLCFYYISSLFEERPESGIHGQAVVDMSAIIGRDVSIGPFCTIEECSIGNSVIIESGVKLHKGTVIGNNVHIQSNSIIGANGVMWAWDEHKSKIRCVQTGNVIIEDDVFVGSNITIVRGSFENRPTIVGEHTMIAHGTMIGHSSVIGAYNHFANNVSIAGSVQTGKYCFFGAGVSVKPHVKLPEDTIVGVGAVVVKDFSESGLVLVGNPARKLVSKKDTLSGIPAPFSS